MEVSIQGLMEEIRKPISRSDLKLSFRTREFFESKADGRRKHRRLNAFGGVGPIDIAGIGVVFWINTR